MCHAARRHNERVVFVGVNLAIRKPGTENVSSVEAKPSRLHVGGESDVCVSYCLGSLLLPKVKSAEMSLSLKGARRVHLCWH